MKKVKYIGIAVVIIAAIILALVNNKAKMQASVKKATKDTYYVSVVAAETKTNSEQISFTGTVFANNDVNLVSETSGKVTAVFAKVGDYRAAGSLIAQVDDELKKAAFALAEANYQKAKKDYERFKQLFEQKSTTEAQLDQMKLAFVSSESQYIIARRQLNDTKITTPISGVLTSRLIDIGSMVQNNMTVGNIVDISRLKVKVNVSERDVVRLRAGDKVNISSDVHPGAVYDGSVETISAKGDEAHTYPVEISVRNDSKNPLKAGMFARVYLTSLSGGQIITIPRVAVLGSSRDAKVYVVENNVAKLRQVVVGAEYGAFASIEGGIQPGELVVVNGQNTLTDGTPVTIVK